MRRATGRWSAVGLAAALLLVSACSADIGEPFSTGTTTPGTEPEATTTTLEPPTDIVVRAGINDPKDPTIAVLEYLPEKVTVEVGTPVTFDWSQTIEPHSVTFLEPGQELPPPGSDESLFAPTPATGPIDGSAFVNSGLLPLGPSAVEPLTLEFGAPGTYSYYCVIHPLMIGEVEVVEAGDDADTPVEVAERGAEEAEQWLEEGRDAKAAWVAEDVPRTESGGVTTYEIAMGTSTEHVDILAFHPVPAEIEAGDKIKFVNRSAAPHTASFFGTGAEPIQNPLDPRVNAPAPGPSPQVLSAAGFFNTGLVPPDAPPGATPEAARTFEFTVPRAGDYSYVCILHAASQMVGTVNAS